MSTNFLHATSAPERSVCVVVSLCSCRINIAGMHGLSSKAVCWNNRVDTHRCRKMFSIGGAIYVIILQWPCSIRKHAII